MILKLSNFCRNNGLLVGTLLGAGIGIAIGIGLRELNVSDSTKLLIDYPGQIFTRALQLMILPLILCNLIVGSSSLNAKTNGKIVARALTWFLFTILLNVLLGVVVVVLLHPGLLADSINNVNDTELNSNDNSDYGQKISLLDSFLDLGRNIVPNNLFSAFFQQTQTVYSIASNNNSSLNGSLNNSNETRIIRSINSRDGSNTLGVITFALIFGMVLGTLADENEKAKKLIDVFHALNEVIMTIARGLIWLTPVCVGSLIASKILTASNIGSTSIQLGMFTLALLIALFIYQFIIAQLFFIIILRKNPIQFYLGIMQAMITAFAASSAFMALPVTYRCLENLKLDTRLTRFLLPIALSICKEGTALFIGGATVFMAQMNGIILDYGQLGTVVIVSAAVSIGSAAVPSAALSAMLVSLNALGIPTHDVGLLFAIDWLLDRFRTANGVLGNCYAIAFIEHWSKDELEALTKSSVVETEREFKNVGYKEESKSIACEHNISNV